MTSSPPFGQAARAGVCAALFLAFGALAEPNFLVLHAPKHGLFMGDGWRSPHHNLLVRFAADLLAIPTGVVAWEQQDFAAFTAWSALTLAFMVGPVPADVALQDWSHATFGRPGTRFTVWTQLGDVSIWGAVWGLTFGSLIAGWAADKPALVEMVSLMLEAFGLGQVFQWVPKLLLGREGPKDGEGRAVIWGPSHSLRLFPAGTPSGHASTLYAMMGVVSAYWENPWLTAALQAFGFLFCATMLVDDYHFASDLIWGAAMGWELGEWVVRHRSTHFHNDAQGTPVRVLPLVDPRTGTVAMMLGWTF